MNVCVRTWKECLLLAMRRWSTGGSLLSRAKTNLERINVEYTLRMSDATTEAFALASVLIALFAFAGFVLTRRREPS